MIPCLYASMEKKFDNNGIGKMADAHSCVVTEKRNGSFELEMVYPADGIHADQLEEGNIILAKPSDTGRPQPFRIYKIATPIDGKLTVKARHMCILSLHLVAGKNTTMLSMTATRMFLLVRSRRITSPVKSRIES